MTKGTAIVFAKKHPVSSDRYCYACGARLDWLGDATCWFEVWKAPKTGELTAHEFHLRCEGEKRRTHS